MDRRAFLTAAAGTIAAGTMPFASKAFAGGKKGSVKHDLLVSDPAVLKQLEVVREKAFECVAAGLACMQHCQEEFIKGNVEDFVDCSVSVHQMTPICENTGTLAALKAKAIADFVDGCIRACETCRKACKAHEGHFGHGMHMECKRCMEACIACRDACKELKKLL